MLGQAPAAQAAGRQPGAVLLWPLVSERGNPITESAPWVFVWHPDDHELRQSIDRAIDAARRHEAHVLVLPELWMPPSAIAYLADRLAEGGHGLVLTVAGEHHTPKEVGLVTNEAKVLDGRGRTLFAHGKMAEFGTQSKAGPLRERIVPNRVLRVVPTPWGNLAVAICRDLFFARTSARLEQSHASFVLVPSLSPSVGPHVAALNRIMVSTIASGFGVNRWFEPPPPAREADVDAEAADDRDAVVEAVVEGDGDEGDEPPVWSAFWKVPGRTIADPNGEPPADAGVLIDVFAGTASWAS